jgi:hypothetical protein
MRIFRRRHADLDARITRARRRAEEAAEEAEKSRRRHAAVCEHVVGPLRRAAEQNSFAEILRVSLIEGHGRVT